MNLSELKPVRATIAFAVVALTLGCVDSDEAVAQAPLPPDQVFRYEITASADEILLDFDVADGGYLYRKNFGFDITGDGATLGAARLPDGEMHTDEFFGTQEIYRDTFRIVLPYTRTAAIDSVELEIRLQGCDDNIGICYPPQRWPATVSLPAGPIAAAAPTSSTPASSIFAGTQSDEPLPVEQAFVPNPRFDSANELTVSWLIEPGYYLYRDEFTFDVEGPVHFGAARLPEGTPISDLNFGEVEVYYDSVDIVVPFARASPDEMPLSITVGYRGCKDDSICYPPAEQVFDLTLPPSAEFSTVSSAAGAAAPVMVSEQDAMADLVSNGALIAVLGTFFLAGLGLSLTPCVYPMVPILSGIIAGQSSASTGRSFMLSVSYVLGMAVTYSVAGAITAMAGSQVQAVFQQPWIIASVAALFVVMALSMFGLFELQMPAAIQSRVSALANRQKGGFFGTAMVGALSALIVTTCVAPPLIGALIAIGQSGDVARGSLALFVLAIGMGTPLLLIGASAGQMLPKVGPWMNAIKAGFGVVMVGMAIWMLDRILPDTVTLLLWALLVFLSGVFLGAFDALPAEPKPNRRLAKGIGVLACLYGALMLIGWVLGGDNPIRPVPALTGLVGQPAAPEQEVDFVDVETVAELDGLLASAGAAGRPVFVEFTADWCADCQEMEEYTFPDPSVVAALEQFVAIRIDVTANNDDDQALLTRFQSYGPPTMVFFDRSGEERNPYRLYGYVPADEFSAHAATVAAL